tara:strand:+ start:1071 stop:1502 length:432 start_codon:yes stop_codon:yes gene_type:complete
LLNKNKSKYVGLDYGLRRSGVSISDNNKTISFPLDTLKTNRLLAYLKELSNNENIEKIIIGKPLKLNNESHNLEKYILEFIDSLKLNLPNICIERVDERFTSKISKKIVIASGLNRERRKDKSIIDKISASLILESYLNQKNK